MSDLALEDIGSTTPGRYGAGSADLVLAKTTIAAAWNVQGNATQPLFVAEAQRLFAIVLPTAPNTTTKGDAVTAFWLGPRSWLLVAGGPSPALGGLGEPSSALGGLSDFTAKRDSLNAIGAALFDLSASRVAYTLSGKEAVNVLTSGCPLDLHPRVFPGGACAQSVFGHVSALVYKPDESPSFTLMVARSFARDIWQALCVAAAQYGYDVAPSGVLR